MNALKVGLIVGSLSAVISFCIGIFAEKNEKLRRFVKLGSSVYFGYHPGFVGSIIGAFWGFLDGFLSGAIIIMLYNFIIRR